MTEASQPSHGSTHRRKHGHARDGHETPEYTAWCAMWARCRQPHRNSYHNYGGRGIRVCARWRSFPNFLADMGLKPSSRHSLDRRDNDGNYEPSNCHWATKREQDNNKRTCWRISFDGETHTMREWSILLGLHFATLHYRLTRGNWSIADALAVAPSHANRRQNRQTRNPPNTPRQLPLI